MLPVIEPNAQSIARRIVASAVLLTTVSLLPHRIGMADRIYLMVAVAGGSGLLYFGARLARDRTSARARLMLPASVLYLPILLAVMVLDATSVNKSISQ